MAGQSNADRIREIRASLGARTHVRAVVDSLPIEDESDVRERYERELAALRDRYEAVVADKDAEIAMLRERLNE